MDKLLQLVNKKFLIILGGILIIIILLFIFLSVISPVCGGEEKIVNIQKGWGSNEMAQELKNQELIRSKWFFVFYVWFRGYNEHLQAGEYLFNQGMTVFEISERIAKGQVAPNWVKVTIPEGWTNRQIEQRLKEYQVVDAELPLEGYLFPDTYYFYRNSSVEDVVQKMRDNFNNKVDDLLKEIEKQGRTLEEIVIMASIIEREVITDKDRAIVSGIFWDRLKINYPLESCATIAYVLGLDKWRYSYEDTRIDSPYNTYINPGLPPTPINNPGLSAIKAAVYPEYTDYMFFLSANDGTTIFSVTLDEHNENKVKYLDK